jgi:primosomal protein N' (replication factor Y) (superfamily II helicase)
LISVAIDTPMAGSLSYSWVGEKPSPGDWVLAPFGNKTVLGLVIADPPQAIAAEKIKAIHGKIPCFPAVDSAWIEFMAFASRYYRRPLGAVAVGMLPKWLRETKNYQPKSTKNVGSIPADQQALSEQAGKRNFDRCLAQAGRLNATGAAAPEITTPESLNSDQEKALLAIQTPGVHVLHGVTGSGKTRVYTQAAQHVLAKSDRAQVLMMVPEIGLTPQLVDRFRQALPGIEIAVLHSEVSERERARLWLSAATGQARLVIGTRLAIMTPMPGLTLIMVDEEHDHSYKQQEGMRYSARDLAVWRTQQLQISLVLGSATPSVETWAQIERGKYQRLSLPHRATGEPHAPIRLVDTLKDPAREGLSEASRQAIAQVLSDHGQALVFLNRRGYAPVLTCASCGWASACKDCHVPSVLHKFSKNLHEPLATTPSSTTHGQWRLQCHHCGLSGAVPKQCPDCGDSDLAPVGRGVQRLEQTLQEAFPKARILRIDRDTVRQGKALQEQINIIERGEVDIVVGTQMLAKGHDFAHMRLVVVADADTQLLNPDFRAPERLFATLMQVAGRAGRHEKSGSPAQVLIQTRYPQHRLYRQLMLQNVEGFIHEEMNDRKAAGLPPFSHMAAIRAGHADSQKVQAGLRQLKANIESAAAASSQSIAVYGPVARYPEIQAGKWRGQIMLESPSRPQLHQFLEIAEDWIQQNRMFDAHIDVDPHEV